MNQSEQFCRIIKRYVPANAVDYCLELWQENPFHFKVSRSRVSKYGDYRYDGRLRSHTITVNHNLNQYAFLITYIHEVAHRISRERFGRKEPHGKEWKATFRKIMLPLLNDGVFPPDLLKVLAEHMKNPKASSGSDLKLAQALTQFDVLDQVDHTLLMDLQLGAKFVLKKRIFEKQEDKRTRILCKEVNTGLKYLIPKLAKVKCIG